MHVTVNDGTGKPIKLELDSVYAAFRALKECDEIKEFMTRNRVLPSASQAAGTRDYCGGLDDYAAITIAFDICDRLIAASKGAGETPSKIETSHIIRKIDGGAFAMRLAFPYSPDYQSFLTRSVIFPDELSFSFDGTSCAGDRFTWIESGFTYQLQARSEIAACDEAARLMLSMHTQRVRIRASFDTGYDIIAPTGLEAIWLDYALTVANSPIIVCEECGKPIIENKRQRRFKRRFCSDKCRVRNARKKQAEKNQEIARLTGRGDNR